MTPLNLRLLYLPSASLPQFYPRRIPLPLPESPKNLFGRNASSSFSALSPFPISFPGFQPRVSISGAEKHAQKEEEEEDSGGISVEYEDLGVEGEIFGKTLRLVECAMFASISGLAYFLSNSLAIEAREEAINASFFPNGWEEESLNYVHASTDDGPLQKNIYMRTYESRLWKIGQQPLWSCLSRARYLGFLNYFGCFFSLPIVISSIRWGVAAGRKTMVATSMLLLTLAGPVKASTYLLMHGVVGLAMGSLWRLQINWGVSIVLCTVVRATGALGYVLLSSFLIRENILDLITINLHASLTYVLMAVGVNTIPSMDAIYAIFGSLLLLNCGFFVFLLHILYAVFIAKLGMKASLILPEWLEKAI